MLNQEKIKTGKEHLVRVEKDYDSFIDEQMKLRGNKSISEFLSELLKEEQIRIETKKLVLAKQAEFRELKEKYRIAKGR